MPRDGGEDKLMEEEVWHFIPSRPQTPCLMH